MFERQESLIATTLPPTKTTESSSIDSLILKFLEAALGNDDGTNSTETMDRTRRHGEMLRYVMLFLEKRAFE